MKTLLPNKLSVKRMTIANLSGNNKKSQSGRTDPPTGTMTIFLW